MDEYAQAKGRIYQNGRSHIFNREDQWSNTLSRSGVSRVSFGLDIPHEAESWGMTGHGKEAYLCRGSTEILALNQMSVTGLHNAANAIASGALCRAIGIEDYAIIKGLIQFKGLPHRVEKIDSFQNVDFYDDSKGTNVGATVAALKGMLQPVILIAGGDGKAQDFNALATAVRECARAIVLIGRDAPQIAELIGGDFSVHFAADMAEAVELAYQLANSGDAVLLSPACASYDMYRSYVHRAEVFVSAVSALKRGQS
jgi:UDP-N-acetylmuramoylalanine--D-glutamate ligase